MAKTTIPTAEGAVLRFFRHAKGLSEEELATRAGVAPHTVGRWENGLTPLLPEELAALLDEHLDVPLAATYAALEAHRLGTQPKAAGGPGSLTESERRLVDQAVEAGGRSGAERARHKLGLDRLRQRAARHRAWAVERWSRIKKLSPELQAKAVQVLHGDERSWALAVWIAEASTAAAAHSTSEPMRLAELAVGLADGDPGEERWRLRLLGHCEPFLANAQRVGGSPTKAGDWFARADEHWARGEGGDPARLLDGTRRLALKAALLKDQDRTGEAISLIDQALGEVGEAGRASLLINKAITLEVAGDYEVALETLREAETRLDPGRDSRLLFACHFNACVNLCHLDRYSEAGALLPLVEVTGGDLRTRLDGVRILWLKGRTYGGLGKREEAIAALSRVREFFLAEEVAYDFALVTVELATLRLEQGHTRLVKGLAEELLWVCTGELVHKGALMALTLFCHALKEEEATSDWSRRLVKFLYRARRNPSLRFEA